MGFGTGGSRPYDAFVAKYGLVTGFGGLLDLKTIFGGLVKETSFVRDRVSHFCDLLESILDHF